MKMMTNKMKPANFPPGTKTPKVGGGGGAASTGRLSNPKAGNVAYLVRYSLISFMIFQYTACVVSLKA
jgi:hypothetical protein